MSGPYETEEQAHAEWLPQAVRDLAAGAQGHLAREWCTDALLGACQQAGVTLGAYDERIIRWLAMWEPETVQVIIGLVDRAHEAGIRAGRESVTPATST